MKNLSIRIKITLWFALLLLVIVALTYAVVLSVSKSYMDKSVQDTLIETVENNVDEIEYFDNKEDAEDDNDGDQYVSYSDGYLEIDDDYLDRVNGVSTSLYQADFSLLYGENPIAKAVSELSFSDRKVQKITVNGTVWYVFDRALSQNKLDGLWLRGVISAEQETTRFSAIVRVSLYIMPLLLLIAIIGGYIIVTRSLRPIKQIVKTASEINRGQDLEKRIDIGKGTDELHMLSNTFNDMLDRLESSFNAEKQFTSDASHELRTPTAVIIAQCDYTLEKERSGEEYREAMSVIRKQGSKMSRLVDDMLSFTRMEQKTNKYEMSDTDLSGIVQSVCEDMALIQNKGISLSRDIEPDIRVSGNAQLLTRLLTILIDNAYRYGKENGAIGVSLHTEQGDALLKVKDNGLGISSEDLPHIFQRFYQAERSRSGTGTGLGLSMAQEIVRLHGGSISAESTPEIGSTFFVRIKKSKTLMLL